MDKQRTYEQGIVAGVALTAIGLALYESWRLLYLVERINHKARRSYRDRLMEEEHKA